ncbi:hypothetical protein BUALT_Bualt14G0060900 [Buddleja alternifolia]|uniref:Large ribosomal subunit protein bL28c n=1 Tax=Buddleja alternifolia TaxID=168488 RepID=A0AAV6WII0_9LAMI|nr:hypothetical protein BUALT_Bualt14G0060900 [Buddleja alternifolia]
MATITATLGPVMVGVAVAKSQNLNRLSMKSSRTSTEIGSLASEMSGMKISSITHFHNSAPLPISAPLHPIVARRICPFTGKKPNKANRVSHSNHRTIRRQFVNLQYKKIWWEAGKRYVKLRLSTKAIKTIEKNGLDAVAKKAGIDLSKM